MLIRNAVSKEVFVVPYYAGLSIFDNMEAIHRRARSLRRGPYKHWDLRVLPWHSQMGEVDKPEMWRSALTLEQAGGAGPND